MDIRHYLITIAATTALAIGVARVAANKPLAPTAAMPAGEAAQTGQTKQVFGSQDKPEQESSPRQAPVEIRPDK